MKNKDPWAEIDAMVASSEAPEGWFHRGQLAKRWDCSTHTARSKAESLTQSGFMESRSFKASNGRETIFYRPLGQKHK